MVVYIFSAVSFFHIHPVARPNIHSFVKKPNKSPTNDPESKASLAIYPIALPIVSAFDFDSIVSKVQGVCNDMKILM